MKDIGVALNTQTTYEDDYGNTKMLSVTDHSQKQTVGFNKKMKKEEVKELNNYLTSVDKEYVNNIKNCNQLFYTKLIINDIWASMILYDDESKVFSWDIKKLNNFSENRDMLWALGRYIDKLNDSIDVTN